MMMMMMTILLPHVSLTLSSSRGCFEKTEKKTTPLSGGALIRAERERFRADFYASFFSRISFPLLFFVQNDGTFVTKMVDT